MNRSVILHKGVIKSYVLVILALILAMFPRLVTAMGAPKVINFLHFFFIVVVFLLVILHKVERRNFQFFFALALLFLVIFLSAVINGAGIINVLLDFLLLSEPFLLFLAIINIPWSQVSIKRFRFYLLAIVFLHVCIVYFQYLVMGLSGDEVEGLFLYMGAGCHLAGVVALTAALYIFFAIKAWPLWLRATVAILCSVVVIFSDTKQAIAVFLFSAIVLLLLRVGNFRKMARYLALIVIGTAIVIVGARTFYPALGVWISIDLLSEGLSQKFSVVPIIISFYDSALNWVFGMGPGHTVGRLGWLMPQYYQYLEPLGATISPVTGSVWIAHQGHYMSHSITGSSMFSLFFSWSGIWGDLGIAGLLVYLYLWYLVWKKVCIDDLSRFLVITILVLGGIFSWMEEPGYMLFVICIIGIRWQEIRGLDVTHSKRYKKSFFRISGFHDNPASS